MKLKKYSTIEKTIPFNHNNLIKCYKDSISKNIEFETYEDFMNYYKITGCDRSSKAQFNAKWRGQMKQFVVLQFGKLRKKGINFDNVIQLRPRAGTSNKFTPKKQGVKTVTNEKIKIEKESVKVLDECILLQLRKSQDYQNPNSNIKQAMHYRRGVDTIHDMIHQKLLRAQSLLEAEGDPKFESLEDTYKDMINYCSFAVSYMRGKMDGQND